MLSFLKNIFLTKEIVSKTGEIHFRRYRLLQTHWFGIYVHNILKSDEEKDPHNHPWPFISIILKGGYIEKIFLKNHFDMFHPKIHWSIEVNKPGTIIRRNIEKFHKITLLKPTWTLVFVGKRKNEPWGYLTDNGQIDYLDYRKNKNGNSNHNKFIL